MISHLLALYLKVGGRPPRAWPPMSGLHLWQCGFIIESLRFRHDKEVDLLFLPELDKAVWLMM